MKLLQSFGPNPRRVRMFIKEKGVELEQEEIDIAGAENRGEAYRRKNPAGQIPALILDDGFVLSETVAICQYLDEEYPDPPLIGTNARQRAETQMWVRRVELDVTGYMMDGFRYAEGLKMFKDRIRCLPEAADGLKARGRDGLQWLNGLLGGNTWLAGGRFTLADICLYCDLDFLASVGQPLDPALTHVVAWFKRVDGRPTATASLHPAATKIHMRG
ncbi:MAG TPA: glutathione S-transferase family protein [Nevskiaceae bacterium]|nr:glutathione S-transferase family protein [Nevskiaceae bacterium]